MHSKPVPVVLLVLTSLISAPGLLAQQTDALEWVRAPEARFPRQIDPVPIEFGDDAARFEADSSNTRAARFGHTVLPAVAGSYIGFLGGFYTMAVITDSSGADFATLVIAEGLGAGLGATLVSSVSAHTLGAPADDASFGRSLGGALLGAVPAAFAAGVAGEASYEVGVGFAIVQGVTTALFTAW